jgi:hypothetical protein
MRLYRDRLKTQHCADGEIKVKFNEESDYEVVPQSMVKFFELSREEVVSIHEARELDQDDYHNEVNKNENDQR